MKDKICVVTGGSQGIGKATAVGLAQMEATVIIVCRDKQRGLATRQHIIEITRNPDIHLELADLSVAGEIRQLAHRLQSKFPAIHILINNHTAFFFERQISRDGIEMNFALNHLAYYHLTMLLLEKSQTQPLRIINVSAEVHRNITSGFLNDLYFREAYNPWDAYCQAKLCNILFTYELARRIDNPQVTANCLHPGTAATKALKDARDIYTMIHGETEFTVPGTHESAAQTSLYLATSPEVEDISGQYFVNQVAMQSSDLSYDRGLAESLWHICADLTGMTI